MSATSPIEQLQNRLGCEWVAIEKAVKTTAQQKAILTEAFNSRLAPDTSVVLFGSIARQEITSGSDSDWILLVDGQAFPEHEDQRRDVSKMLADKGFGEPGRSGVFGCMVGSHSLIHEIGGADDTNSNTTRRVLLLLESLPIGDSAAYTRVRRQILNRYVRDDRGLMYGSGGFRVPRFLLNDLTRYWRTVTVDFVYKQRADAGEKWALRNAKLRMSRKLVFASELLRCFFCHLDPNAADARRDLTSNHDPNGLIAYMESELMVTPLQLLARAALSPQVREETAKNLFDAYDAFLELIDNEESRAQLKNLKPSDLATSTTWERVTGLSKQFQSSLTALFYGSDKQLRELIIEYGVF